MTEPDVVFYERLAGMPFVEAEQECLLRREGLVLELSMLLNERNKCAAHGKEADDIGAEMKAIESQLAKLNGRIKELRKTQDRISWKAAIQALYGSEAVHECLVWMEVQRPIHEV